MHSGLNSSTKLAFTLPISSEYRTELGESATALNVSSELASAMWKVALVVDEPRVLCVVGHLEIADALVDQRCRPTASLQVLRW
jgi:hypothetical protein